MRGDFSPLPKNMKKYTHITKKLLSNLYLVNKKTTWEISEFLKIGATTIKRYLKIFEIPVRHTRNTKGKNNPFYRKHHTIKAKQKIIKWLLGKKHTEETKRKIRESGLGDKNHFFGKHHSEETKEQISKLLLGENNPNWQGGISFEPYSLLWTEELKTKIRQRDNCECQNCGMTQEEHFIVAGYDLNVHHIDYNKKNCSENNLITTCLWCNSRANFNRSYWQNFYNNKIKLISIKGN